MINHEEIETWDTMHQIAYLFMCVANADYVITEDEIDIIKNRLTELFGANDKYDSVIKDVRREVLSQNEFEKTEAIRKVVPMFCDNQPLKERFLRILEEIMGVDKVMSVEKITYRFIKKTIETCG
jgi:hypothetical protein